jgi:hypothetical protein
MAVPGSGPGTAMTVSLELGRKRQSAAPFDLAIYCEKPNHVLYVYR